MPSVEPRVPRSSEGCAGFLHGASRTFDNLTKLRISGAMVRTLHSASRSLGRRIAILSPTNVAPLEYLELYLYDILDEIELSNALTNLRTERLRWLSITASPDNWFLGIMEFVSRCTEVEEFTLVVDVPEGTVHAPFALGKVKKCTIGGCLPYWFLHTISMPALETLCFDGDITPVPETITTLPGVVFPRLHTFVFENYLFSDNDVPVLSTFFRLNPTIETVHATFCERHRFIVLAMLDPGNEDGAARPLLEPALKSVGTNAEHQDAQKRMMPKLKSLHFSSQQHCAAYEEAAYAHNLADVFSEVLSLWEAVHIEVEEWDSWGGTETDVQLLTSQYEGRFTFRGKCPDETDSSASASDPDSDSDGNVDSDEE